MPLFKLEDIEVNSILITHTDKKFNSEWQKVFIMPLEKGRQTHEVIIVPEAISVVFMLTNESNSDVEYCLKVEDDSYLSAAKTVCFHAGLLTICTTIETYMKQIDSVKK